MSLIDTEKEESLALRDREELEGTLLPVANAVPVVSQPDDLPVATATATLIDYAQSAPGTTAARLAPFMSDEDMVPSNYPDQNRYRRGDDEQMAALATHTGRMDARIERQVVRQADSRTAAYNAQQDQGVAVANFTAHQENRWEQANRTVPIATPPVEVTALEDAKKKEEESGYAFGTGKGGYEVREYEVTEYSTGTYETSEYKSVYD